MLVIRRGTFADDHDVARIAGVAGGFFESDRERLDQHEHSHDHADAENRRQRRRQRTSTLRKL